MSRRWNDDMEERANITRKAHDAYALARQLGEKIAGLDGAMAALRAEIAGLHADNADLRAEVRRLDEIVAAEIGPPAVRTPPKKPAAKLQGVRAPRGPGPFVAKTGVPH